MPRQNTTLDDVCALIGLSATVRLVERCGGRNVYIPNEATPGHVIAKVASDAALARLVEMFGGTTLWVPSALGGRYSGADRTKGVARELFRRGKSNVEVAQVLGTSLRSAQRLRAVIVDEDTLDAECPPQEFPGEMPGEKTPHQPLAEAPLSGQGLGARAPLLARCGACGRTMGA